MNYSEMKVTKSSVPVNNGSGLNWEVDALSDGINLITIMQMQGHADYFVTVYRKNDIVDYGVIEGAYGGRKQIIEEILPKTTPKTTIPYSKIQTIHWSKKDGHFELWYPTKYARASVYCYCDEGVANLLYEKVGKEHGDLDKIQKKGKAQDVAVRLFLLAIAVGLVIWLASAVINNHGNDNKYDNLTEEEQEWYDNNYGDGQMEDIQKAIDEYEE